MAGIIRTYTKFITSTPAYFYTSDGDLFNSELTESNFDAVVSTSTVIDPEFVIEDIELKPVPVLNTNTVETPTFTPGTVSISVDSVENVSTVNTPQIGEGIGIWLVEPSVTTTWTEV